MSAVTVVKIKNGKLELDEEQLKEILHHPRARNKHVVVISISGALRKGKTTLLNFIKAFLEKRWGGQNEDNQLLHGFLAKQGSDPVTEGIVMWSVPFILHLDGEDVAVFLVDTEGAFEIGSDNEASSAVFALSSLISSVQIFNVMHIVDQRDFELLALFGRYATAISAASKEIEAFQKLVILVRDWLSPRDIKYGPASLELYLNKASKKHESREWQAIRYEFEQTFSDISCHMLPHPGQKVAVCTDELKSDFYFNDFDEEFITNMKQFIERLLKNDVVKKVGGEKIKSDELFELFKEYYNVFKAGKVSPPESILKVTAQQGYFKAFQGAINYYKSEIRNYFERKGYFITIDGLKEKMEEAEDHASGIFEDSPLIAHPELQTEYQEKFSKEIKDIENESVQQATVTENLRKMAIGATVALVGAVGGVSTGVVTGMSWAERVGAAAVGALAGGSGTLIGSKSIKKIQEKKEKKSN
jgi:atlastin